MPKIVTYIKEKKKMPKIINVLCPNMHLIKALEK